MTKWPLVRLGDIAADEKSAISKPYGSAILRDDYRDAGVPVVRGVNLARGRFYDDEFVFISEDLADHMPGARLQPGDLVFTHRGSVGQISMIPRAPRFHRYTLSTSQVKARLDPARAIPEFFYYWFLSPAGRNSILQSISTVGVPGLARPVETIKSLPVPLPPLDEQRRIAGVLGALDDLIDSLEVTCAQIDQLQHAIFRSQWDGSTRVPLSGLCTITMGQSPPGETYNETGEVLPFYQGVKDFGLRYPNRRVHCTSPTRLAHNGDVLIAVRAPIGNTNVAVEDCSIGRGLAALASDCPGTTLQALRCDPNLWARFQGDGTVFAAVNKQTLAANRVPWIENQRLEMVLAPMDALYRECWDEAKRLRKHRDELLPLLLSGRVRVVDVAA
jgi:type I restriction enzyme, S subunit